MGRVSSKAVADTVGMLAVVLSLIFVGLQIRQNTIATRAAAYQAIGFHGSDIMIAEAMDHAFAALRVAALDSAQWGSIDAAGWYQLEQRLTGYMRAVEAVYLEVEEGLLPRDALQRFGLDVTTGTRTYPFGRLWPAVRPRLSAKFAAYVEAQLNIDGS